MVRIAVASWSLLLFLSFVLLPNRVHAQSESGLKLEITTKLGVKTVINTKGGWIRDFDKQENQWFSLFGFYDNGSLPALTLQTSDDSAVVLPWQSIKEVVSRDGRQVVIQTNGTEHSGKILTGVISADDKDKIYEPSTVTSMKVLSAPALKAAAKTEKTKTEETKQWTLTHGSAAGKVVSHPRLNFVYIEQSYSPGFYSPGRTHHDPRHKLTTGFVTIVNGEEITTNIDDFESVEWGGTKEKPTVTVKAKDGMPIAGDLKREVFKYQALEYALVVDLPEGGTLVLKNPKCKLQLK